MSDKRKARIRALMAELNISYQAADNLLKGEAQRAARATAESPSEAAADQVATAVPLASVDPFLHDERLRDPVGLPGDRDLAFLHDLEQRALHLRRRPVDLVGKQKIGEHGS